MLEEFIATHREEIIARCRARVARRAVPPATKAEIDHGVPLFLTQLIDALRLGLSSSSQEIDATAVQHGHDLRLQGLTLSQVVHDYGDVCQVITGLAGEINAPIGTADFRVLNRCLDDAIAGAVTQYAREGNQSATEGETARGSEQFGIFAHELGNLINTAIVAFEVLKSGNVGVAGSTAAVLGRSLTGLQALVRRSLAEIRLRQGVHHQEQFLVSTFIDELTPAATLEAHARHVKLVVAPVEHGLVIEADRQILAAVVMNLLQNAFKFTRPRTTVTLRVGASAARVLIEIQDECDGLPGPNIDELFRPFEQRGTDRTGVGLGLAFCRWGIEANHGRIYAKNLPAVGCIFTVDMPRLPTLAGATT